MTETKIPTPSSQPCTVSPDNYDRCCKLRQKIPQIVRQTGEHFIGGDLRGAAHLAEQVHTYRAELNDLEADQIAAARCMFRKQTQNIN